MKENDPSTSEASLSLCMEYKKTSHSKSRCVCCKSQQVANAVNYTIEKMRVTTSSCNSRHTKHR